MIDDMLYHDTTKHTYTSPDRSIPPGFYACMITDVQTRTAKTSGKDYISFTLDVIDGKHEGRKVFDNLFVKSDSDFAVEIARNKLHTLALALDEKVLKSKDQVMNRTVIVEIDVEKKDDRNVVRGYRKFESSKRIEKELEKEEDLGDEIPFI